MCKGPAKALGYLFAKVGGAREDIARTFRTEFRFVDRGNSNSRTTSPRDDHILAAFRSFNQL